MASFPYLSSRLNRHHNRTHRTRASIHHQILTRDITTEPTRQKPNHLADLSRIPRPLQPNIRLLNLLTLQIRGGQLRIHPPHIHPLQINPDVDLAGTDTVDAHACAFEDGNPGANDPERRVRGHGEAGAPAAAVGAGGAGDDDDGAVGAIFGRGVGVVAFWCCFGHGVGDVFEGEEGGHGVGFEALLEVGGGGEFDAGGAEEAGIADPDVETAPRVEGFVDEGQGVGFGGDGVGVVDDFGVGVEFGEGVGEAGGLRDLRAGVDARCAMGGEFGCDGFPYRLVGGGDDADEAVELPVWSVG